MVADDAQSTGSFDEPVDNLDSFPFDLVQALSLNKTDLVTVSPDTILQAAVKQMLDQQVSQIPVVDNGVCRGVLSFASVVRTAIELETEPLRMMNLQVKDALEPAHYVSPTDTGTFSDLFKRLSDDAYLLVGERNNLKSVLTTFDLLNYFHNVAGPYILAREVPCPP